MFTSKLKAAVRHLGVLLSSLGSQTDRHQLRRFFTLLNSVVANYQQGGLPALSRAIEPEPYLYFEPDALERALAQIEALVAFSLTSNFRTCLRRAALRFYVLRAARQSVVLVIGVKRTQQPAGLDGHAWVEVDGQPFRDDLKLIKSQMVMYRYPSEPAANV